MTMTRTTPMHSPTLFVLAVIALICTLTAREQTASPYTWNRKNRFQGWRQQDNVTCTNEGTCLTLTDLKADAQLLGPILNLDPATINRFSFRYRAVNTGKAGGQLFFAHTPNSFNARKYWKLPPLIADGTWHTTTVTEKDIPYPANWFHGGTIVQLRLDPTDSPGGFVQIKDIRLFFQPKN